jgi:hypothetical protein
MSGRGARVRDEFWGPLDFTRPNIARVYGYLLGGKDHVASDRALANSILAWGPALRLAARENRRFLCRAVRYLAAEAGVRPFLDVGVGLPHAENVHEIAQATDPASRVVYADNDPQVLVHGKALLRSHPHGRVGFADWDLREDPAILLGEAGRVLDLTQPVALLLLGVLPFVTDAGQPPPAEIVPALVDALPPGSYLAASHMTAEHDRLVFAVAGEEFRRRGIAVQFRDSGEFARMAFSGLALVPPGVTLVSEWRPQGDGPRPSAAEVSCYGGVGQKA